MAFKHLGGQRLGVDLLQRSLQRGRLAQAYLFAGDRLEFLEMLARTLSKTLNCVKPVLRGTAAIDCCDACVACRKIEHGNHPDVHWVRPESKSRVITIDEMRELMREIQLKPNEAAHKIAIIVAADRLRVEAANAFLKCLEEPPVGSTLILLTAVPQRILPTILSRCLRLNFASDSAANLDTADLGWLSGFSDIAAKEQKSLLGRYRLLDFLLKKLGGLKANIEQTLTARSPLQQYKDAEKDISAKWEAELAAMIEAEYRRQRVDLLAVVQWWLRDIWLRTLEKQEPAQKVTDGIPGSKAIKHIGVDGLLSFPQMAGTQQVAQRISPRQAKENLYIFEELQRRVNTNVQEALALEVGLLKLNL